MPAPTTGQAEIPVVRLNQADEPPAKLCINCRWCVHHQSGAEDLYLCDQPVMRQRSPVTGAVARVFCLTERQSQRSLHCGPTGVFFEPREIVSEAAE